MRKTFQPTVRKVYGGSPQSSVVSSPAGQTTTVRRVVANSSDQNAPRILKQATIATTPARVLTQQQHHAISANSSSPTSNSGMKCYICDCWPGGQGQLLMDTMTNTTHTKLPNKIGRVIGDSFLVIVRADDIVCKRCVGLFNQFDQLETQLETVTKQLMGFITKKYAIDADDSSRGPATKLQKMNSGSAVDATPPAMQPISQQVTQSSTTTTTVVRKVVAQTLPVSPGSRKPPVKIYKCMSCDFTTSDLKQFTPHYSVCPGVGAENGGGGAGDTVYEKTVATSSNTAPHQTTSPASAAGTPKLVARRPLTQSLQKAEAAAVVANSPVQHTCNQCSFKTQSRPLYEEHMRRHQVKVKPFKCRICSARFEDRETASKHARAHSTEYYKCGTCSVAYRDRNQLIKHFEVHRNDGSGGQHVIIKASSTNVAKQQLAGKTGPAIVGQPQLASTQRLLQETIDEACNEAAVDTKNIHFFSCAICSLTFIQENYYTAHMETHKEQAEGTTGSPQKKTGASPAAGKQPQSRRKTPNGQGMNKDQNDDLESIFEKMHSEKGQHGNDVSSTGIDMPALDQGDDEGQETSVAVSMPSLDDDADGGAAAGEAAAAQEAAAGDVPMEIDDMQNSVEGGEQLKFVLNENGQLLQLDNHILTDAEGNQIIVQGADPEHLQQLLQSVGIEGGTLQMIQGENNQMILVQQDGEQAQLIDASMLNADGQIVIQQAQGGEGELSQDGVVPEGEDGQQQQHHEHHQGEEGGETEQVQFDASDVAHQEAAAVLAAAAEQHVLLQAAVAVDESSQEDLGGAAAEAEAQSVAHEGEQTSQDEVTASQAETQQLTGEETQEQHGTEETSQEAHEAAASEQQQQQQEAEASNAAAGDEDYDQLIPTC